MKYYTNKARQAGMTLIELTVVLLVLVGLAGLLIPYVSGFVTKTHDSTGASNIQALNNAMQRYAVEHYDNYPDKMDSLIQANGEIFPKMMDELMPMGTNKYFKVTEIDSAQANALKAAGIKNIAVMNDGESDATFANTVTVNGVVTTVAVANGINVLEITGMPLNDLSHRLGKPTNTGLYHYFAFGIGDDSTIAGATVSDVPVHFSRNGDMGANKAYNHFVALFEVLKGGACDVSGYAVAQEYDVDVSTFNMTAAVTPVTTITPLTQVGDGDGATDVASCNALASTESIAVTGALDGSGAAATVNVVYTDAASIQWLNPNTDTAKFMGATMAMGMGNLEGLGGSMTRYYENSAQN